MSTKAQDYRVEQQRTAHPPRPKSPKRLRKEANRLGLLEAESPLETAGKGPRARLAGLLTRPATPRTSSPKARALQAAARGHR